jgi:heme oxygenase (mycobilin-producing)
MLGDDYNQRNEGLKMIVTSNRISVHPDYGEAFEESFKNRASKVDGMAGFISFQLLRPTKEGDPYIVMTTWESKADFEGWTNSDAFKQGHAKSGTLPREAFLDRPTLEIHEIIQ